MLKEQQEAEARRLDALTLCYMFLLVQPGIAVL
jgi:hypothetical protein